MSQETVPLSAHSSSDRRYRAYKNSRGECSPNSTDGLAYSAFSGAVSVMQGCPGSCMSTTLGFEYFAYRSTERW